ncbi:unnamed protein product [Arabidopsis lyrata]|nr:unnamed protein product [Arabidopsis lyrata]
METMMIQPEWTTFLQLKFSLHALSLQLMVLGVAQISLYPILMSKGSTTVALYG